MKGLLIALQYHHKAAEGRFGGERAVSPHDGEAARPARGLLIPAGASLRRPGRRWAPGSFSARPGRKALIADAEQRLAARAGRAAGAERWPSLDPGDDEYRRVKFRAAFVPAGRRWSMRRGSALRRDVSGPGYWVFTPARLAGGGVVIVNRGFVPEARKAPRARPAASRRDASRSSACCAGRSSAYLVFADDDPARNLWFAARPARDRRRQGLGDGSAPFYVEQEAPVPPGGLPRPGKLDGRAAQRAPAIRVHLVRPRRRPAGRVRRLGVRARAASAPPPERPPAPAGLSPLPLWKRGLFY